MADRTTRMLLGLALLLGLAGAAGLAAAGEPTESVRAPSLAGGAEVEYVDVPGDDGTVQADAAEKGLYNIEAAVEITDTAINQFIFNQWQINDITQELSGEQNGFTYLIQLSPLGVILREDEIGVTMRFHADVTGPLGIHYELDFNIEPTATIPDLSISLSSISAFLESVPALIMAIEMPTEISFIKPLIIAEYENLELTMYPSGILEIANDADWIKYRPMEVTDVGLTLDIAPGVLRIIPSIQVETSYFKTVACLGRSDGEYYMKFNSLNCPGRLAQAKLFNARGQLVDGFTINPATPIELPKAVPTQIFVDREPTIAIAQYFIWALFTTDDTFYLRSYDIRWNGSQFCALYETRTNY